MNFATNTFVISTIDMAAQFDEERFRRELYAKEEKRRKRRYQVYTRNLRSTADPMDFPDDVFF